MNAILERWFIKGDKRFGDTRPDSGERVWIVLDFGDHVRVANETDRCYVTRYDKTEDWRERLEQFTYFYLRAEVTKVEVSDGTVRQYPTLAEWWKNPKFPHEKQ